MSIIFYNVIVDSERIKLTFMFKGILDQDKSPLSLKVLKSLVLVAVNVDLVL